MNEEQRRIKQKFEEKQTEEVRKSIKENKKATKKVRSTFVVLYCFRPESADRAAGYLPGLPACSIPSPIQ